MVQEHQELNDRYWILVLVSILTESHVKLTQTHTKSQNYDVHILNDLYLGYDCVWFYLGKVKLCYVSMQVQPLIVSFVCSKRFFLSFIMSVYLLGSDFECASILHSTFPIQKFHNVEIYFDFIRIMLFLIVIQ